MMIKNFDELVDEVKRSETKKIAVAYAHNKDVIEALERARKENIANGILIGPEEKIKEILSNLKIDQSKYEIIDEEDEKKAVYKAIELIKKGKANVLMKGLCSTATLLKGVLDKEKGLRSENLLSHLAAFQVPTYHKLILMSDAAMNIAPTLMQKVEILKNSVKIAHKLGIETPKVALIAAVEKVNPENMPCTLDAAAITMMNKRGQIKGTIVDGPLAVDNAFSKKSCEVKGIKSEVGGDADIAIVPDIETGNVFYKLLSYLAGAKTAGIIVGAKAPIVLTSRADTDEVKFLSIALAMKTS